MQQFRHRTVFCFAGYQMFPMWKSFIFRKPAPKRLITFCVGGLVESDFPEFIDKTVIEQ